MIINIPNFQITIEDADVISNLKMEQNVYEHSDFNWDNKDCFFSALLTIWLQQWEKKYQAYVDLIDDSKSAPRVILAKKLTENKDGFFEESYGHFHFEMNGRTLASYSY
ncbi:hypothetical protein B9Z55_027881 [Caenorhabditis nigoni]|uniref:Uncharacterized protein n=1 Tax=Caenorhabditis nigoni TaxID=1611254 RepID=A0A2G5SEC9_9PELO|nr:hypothetical protein B9Z55_027881 [Caenorhabditis nigoni]